MKKLLLVLALLFLPSLAWAQCNGLFPPSTVCGNSSLLSNAPPGPIVIPSGTGGVNSAQINAGTDIAISGTCNTTTALNCTVGLAPGTQYTNAVTVCGADPTGVADSSTALTNCLATYHSVALPSGTYKACNVTINDNLASLVGPGVTFGLPPAGGATLVCNQTTGNVISLTPAVAATYVANLTLDRSVVPTSGSGIGVTGNTNSSNMIFRNIVSQNQWNGFEFPPALNGVLDSLVATANYNDGFLFQSYVGNFSIQWYATNILSTVNNRYGVEYIDGFPGYSTWGQWTNIGTFGNGLGGWMFANSYGVGATINDIRLYNLNISSENGNGITFQGTNGEHNIINGALIESQGTIPTGRGFSIPPSHTGWGVAINETDGLEFVITDAFIRGNSFGGINAVGAGRLIVNGGAIGANGQSASNTYAGINISAGNYAIISGVMGQDSNIESYGVFTASPGTTTITGSIFGGITAGCAGNAGPLTHLAANIGVGC